MERDANAPEDNLTDDLAGLFETRKRLPFRLLYDVRGAQLFEALAGTADYYLTHAEEALLGARVRSIAMRLGAHARVIEAGTFGGTRTHMLLRALDRPYSYIAIDVAVEHLVQTVAKVQDEFPLMAEVMPLVADYADHTRELSVSSMPGFRRTLVFLPGSTIGRFEPYEAQAFLERMKRVSARDLMLLIGVDANTNETELVRAFDDADGIAAAFNLNVLTHLNLMYDARIASRACWRRPAGSRSPRSPTNVSGCISTLRGQREPSRTGSLSAPPGT